MSITKDDVARSSQLALCLAKGADDKKLITTATLLNAFLAIKQFRFRLEICFGKLNVLYIFRYALELLEQIPESWWSEFCLLQNLSWLITNFEFGVVI